MYSQFWINNNYLNKLKMKEFLKKYWMVIVNYIVILIAYSTVFEKGMSGTELILGLWIFVSAAYGMYKLFIK